jgi:predicted acyltransferase
MTVIMGYVWKAVINTALWFKSYIIRETGIYFLIKMPCLMWLVNKQ